MQGRLCHSLPLPVPSAADLGWLERSRTPTSPSSRAQRPRPEVSAAWVPLRAVKEARSTPQPGSRCFQEPLAVVGPSITASLPSCSLSFLPKCSSVPGSPVFIRTPGILDWGPPYRYDFIITTYLCSDLVSKKGPIPRCWGLGRPRASFLSPPAPFLP